MNALPFHGISQFLEMPGEFTQSQKVGDCMEIELVIPVSTLGQEEEIQKGIAAIAAEKLAARAETAAKAVIAAEAVVVMALSAARVAVGPLDEAAQETLHLAQKAAAKTLQVAKEVAEETLILAREVAKELLEEASRESARNASSSIKGRLNDS
jgi:hypothetical protein